MAPYNTLSLKRNLRADDATFPRDATTQAARAHQGSTLLCRHQHQPAEPVRTFY
jgi:hypothetical protein